MRGGRMYRWQTLDTIHRAGVVGIVREQTSAAAREAAQRLVAGGLPAVEVTLTTPDALGVIAALADSAAPASCVGAGTVLDPAAAVAAVGAGARFLVCPHLDPEVIRAGHRYGAAVIPGVQTATELVAALAAGADAVKLFPAAAMGPDGMSALLQPVPHAPLIPTGGVAPGDLGTWLRAGAIAVGIGNALREADLDELAGAVRAARSAG